MKQSKLLAIQLFKPNDVQPRLHASEARLMSTANRLLPVGPQQAIVFFYDDPGKDLPLLKVVADSEDTRAKVLDSVQENLLKHGWSA